MFRNFDYQNQGFITIKNIEEAYKRNDMKVDLDEIEENFYDLDFDQDGRINFDDFKQMF